MTLLERAGLGLLHRLEPERAHALSLWALKTGLAPLPGPLDGPKLSVELAGLRFPNPVGLAAGYDKNAVALAALCRAGFGHVEVGAATPRAQAGNARPRLFRLTEDRAVINRFGFNNDGAEAIAGRLAKHPRGAVPVGLNLGANKDSADRAGDFAQVLARCGAHIDFATVNVSSPNTERLRELQGRTALLALLGRVMETRDTLPRRVPVFLKIAPDLGTDEIGEIVEVALSCGVDAIVATNTTLGRDGLTSPLRSQAGGLSGSPLFERATRVLAEISQATGGRLPLIGVGGISNTEQAIAKIRAGATAVQLYSALVYEGLSLVADIVRGIDAELARTGATGVADLVGTGRGDWL